MSIGKFALLAAVAAVLVTPAAEASSVVPVTGTHQTVSVGGEDVPILGVREAALLDDGSVIAEIVIGTQDSAWFHFPLDEGLGLSAGPTLLIREGENFGANRDVNIYYVRGERTYGKGLVIETRVGTVGDVNGVYRREPGLSSEVLTLETLCPGGEVDELVNDVNLSAVTNTGYMFFQSPCASTNLMVATPTDELVALKSSKPLGVTEIVESEPDWVPVLGTYYLTSAQGDRAWVRATVGCGDVNDENVNYFNNNCPDGWPTRAFYELDMTGGRTLVWLEGDPLNGYTFASPGMLTEVRANANGDLIAFGETDDAAGTNVGPDFLAYRLDSEVEFTVVAQVGDMLPSGEEIRYLRAPPGVDVENTDESRAYIDAEGRVTFAARVQGPSLGYGCILRSDGQGGLEKVLCHEDEVIAPTEGWVIDSTIPPSFFGASASGRGMAQWQTRDGNDNYRTALVAQNAEGDFEVVAYLGQTVDVGSEPFVIAGAETETAVGSFEAYWTYHPGGPGQDDGWGRLITNDGKAVLIANDGYGSDRSALFIVDADGEDIVPGSATISVELVPEEEGADLVWGGPARLKITLAASEGDTVQGLDLVAAFTAPPSAHPSASPTSDFEPVSFTWSADGIRCEAPAQTLEGPGAVNIEIPVTLAELQSDQDLTVTVSGGVTLTTADVEVSDEVTESVKFGGFADLSVTLEDLGHRIRFTVTNNSQETAAENVRLGVAGLGVAEEWVVEQGDASCEGAVCDLGTMAPGDVVVVVYEVRKGDYAAWSATVSSDNPDPDMSNNTAGMGDYQVCRCVRPSSGVPWSLGAVLLSVMLAGGRRRARTKQ